MGVTWQKWTALQGFPQASNSGENAIRPKTPGTTASREPWLLDTAGTDVCNKHTHTKNYSGYRFMTTRVCSPQN